MKTIFYTLGTMILLWLAVAIVLYEPPLGETVTASKLARAAEMVAAHPTETPRFKTKIENLTLTNGDLAQLEIEVAAAEQRAAAEEDEQERHASPKMWWAIHRGSWILLAGILFGAVAFELVKFARAQPGERRFFGLAIDFRYGP